MPFFFFKEKVRTPVGEYILSTRVHLKTDFESIPFKISSSIFMSVEKYFQESCV